MATASTPPGVPSASRRSSDRERVRAHARDDGSLVIGPRRLIPASDVAIRVTTSGGPGGQHANRSLTRVIASLDVEASTTLGGADRAVLIERFGPVVRSSAGRFRSQSANREAALDQLARRVADALTPRAPRRATRPTRASKERRLDSKKARSRLKERRQQRDDD
ncbi:MAG TPA: aminoacyl-tRNA hydrolase [Acidimicrobiales bacterium]|nr:aminoacyl-tRNA hydrolase [Acidimicrobiales bacterium]